MVPAGRERTWTYERRMSKTNDQLELDRASLEDLFDNTIPAIRIKAFATVMNVVGSPKRRAAHDEAGALAIPKLVKRPCCATRRPSWLDPSSFQAARTGRLLHRGDYGDGRYGHRLRAVLQSSRPADQPSGLKRRWPSGEGRRTPTDDPISSASFGEVERGARTAC